LAAILNDHVLESQAMPLVWLDALYHRILASISDNTSLIKMILAVILFIDSDYNLFAPLTATQLSITQTLSGIESLFSLECGQTKALLIDLYPMFHCTQLDNILVSHATVAEFFDDHHRCKEHYINKNDFLSTLLEYCFKNIRNGK